MKPFRPPARGFSLIEMVAAFLVFAIGIGVLMQILTTSMRNIRQSSDYTMAALWAESKLDTVGVGRPIEAGRSNGRFDDAYSWELDIQQVDPASVEPPPQQTPAAGSGAKGAGAQNPKVSAANAGLGGGLQVAPFDLYQIDLTVIWGGRFGARPHTANFSTLRVTNPDANKVQRGINLPAPRSGGAKR
ncbi:type IV pilus modification PilV family protein [Dokdonella soli]|uniref:Prepilin-type N-terminal cleavage/methylation domain-containing protein n=1 Tax=Dokdonella soli TaxID=529810 RepID=A0ABN1IIJ4_9GAMM